MLVGRLLFCLNCFGFVISGLSMIACYTVLVLLIVEGRAVTIFATCDFHVISSLLESFIIGKYFTSLFYLGKQVRHLSCSKFFKQKCKT